MNWLARATRTLAFAAVLAAALDLARQTAWYWPAESAAVAVGLAATSAWLGRGADHADAEKPDDTEES